MLLFEHGLIIFFLKLCKDILLYVLPVDKYIFLCYNPHQFESIMRYLFFFHFNKDLLVIKKK